MDKKEWIKSFYNKTIDKAGERKSSFKHSFGDIQPLYDSEDFSPEQSGKIIEFPGIFPYTRGVYPSMYRSRFWTMRQYAGFGSAKESNHRYRYLLEQGQTGLSVAFDLPTQVGLDSSHPLSEGEVGRLGVSIDTIEDMEILFEKIPLDKISVSMTINATAPVILAMYLAVAKKRGISLSQLTGTIQNDILKEYVARGTYIFPPKESLRLISDIFSYCQKNVPRWNTISISGYHIREAGATAVQELAFTFANGLAYVQSALDAGLKLDSFAPRLSFFFAAHNNFFEEIAKFRAARRIWAHLMKDRFGGDGKSAELRFHTQTGGVTLTSQQPMNNIVRVTLQALAAVLGGTQSLHTNSMDEALGLPSEEAVRVALRTQQILAHESGVADTIDPVGGSYYVESLTSSIEKEVHLYLGKIDKMGGMLDAITSGYIHQEIQNSAYEYQKELDSQERIIAGVNQFQEEGSESKLRLHQHSIQSEEKQKKRLAAIKKKRDPMVVQEALQQVFMAAKSGENLMEPIIKAVNVSATLQEISDQLRKVFGEHREHIVF